MHRPRPSLILILTLAGPVFPAQAQTLVCGATAQPSTVRLGGLTELAGDVVVACNAPQPLPSAVTVTITLSFNVLVTSRILSGGVTEALLFVDDPAAPVLGANVFRGALATGSALAWTNVQLAPGIGPSAIFPFAPVPYFTDAPAGHPYFSSIQKLKDLGITTGCTASAYCPDASTTRGQMAVFLVRLLTP